MGNHVTSFVEWAIESFKGQTVTFRGGKDKRQLWPDVVRSFVAAESLSDLGQGFLSFAQRLPYEYEKGFREYEETLFASFKRHARLLVDLSPANDWEWLALAQNITNFQHGCLIGPKIPWWRCISLSALNLASLKAKKTRKTRMCRLFAGVL
jgi:hypothetical protein